jgi:tetratricopeptide (TPR) repeat protein
MTLRRPRALLFLLAALTGAPSRPLAGPAPLDAQLWNYRNLGKAFYENPTTQYEAVEQFRKALELAPESARERLNYGLALLRAGKTDEGIAELENVQRQDASLPHTWFNLGIQYKKRATPDSNLAAIAQLERMIQLVPGDAIAHYNLAYLYKIVGRPLEALKHFETSARLDPNLAGPQFQLYNGYRDPQVGRPGDAARALAAFQAIKKRQAGAAIPEDLEWGYYSEIFDPVDPADSGVDPPPLAPEFQQREIANGVDAVSAGLAVVDADGDERPDAIVWSAAGIRLIAGGDTAVDGSGLEHLRSVVFASSGDFDNDGAADLVVLTGKEATLWRNAGSRRFVPAAPLPAGVFTRALFLDYDHDYDLDLLLLGSRSRLLRNAGAAGFTDVSAEFPFVDGTPTDAVPFEAEPDTLGPDVVVAFADRAGVMYRDRLAGKFEALPIDALPAGSRSIVAQDVNRDGRVDVVAAGPLSTLLLANDGRRLAATDLQQPSGPLAIADFENRGVADILTREGIHRWTPRGLQSARLTPAAARAAADFDGDGRVDLLHVDASGVVRLASNTATTAAKWLRVRLTGVKNVKTAMGSEVEVRAGSRYQKQLYVGTPLHFGLGERDVVDTVRITWPNGLIQNEVRQAPRAVAFKEAPRLSGSCPMIFTWDGTRFRFITDVLGVAPLGASAGDGQYFPVDHDEYVHLPGEALAAVDGRLEVRVTEELREVSYLDRIQLTAIDYPPALTIVTNDKFKGPPFPEFRLFGVDDPIAAVAARNHRGADVRDQLRAADRRYADGFRRDFEGVAELHHLDLDFGGAAPDGRAILVLSGWVDWADGSTFRGVSQERPGGLVLPFLQVKDADGRWQTVIEDMGIPAGKTKTIAVDLSGRFLSASREIRIVTNLCVYWDRIYLSHRTAPPPVVLTPAAAAVAELRFRGFSRPVIDPARRQPESFDYEQVTPLSMWNPTPGMYTRYGDVRALVAAADDRLVVMGSGDEVRLLYDAAAFPPLRPGWRRDYLLLFDGWAKDGDANTAFSQTVEPLPFQSMSAYPYGAAERHPRPDDARAYNTRPALRLLRPLAPQDTGR